MSYYSQVMEKKTESQKNWLSWGYIALQDMARIEPDLSDSRALATNYPMLSCRSVTTIWAEKKCIKLENVHHISALPALYLHTQDRKRPEVRSPSGLSNDQPGEDNWEPAVTSVCWSFYLLMGQHKSGQPTWHSSLYGQQWERVTIIGKDWRETGS